jgi:chromosome segregation ATPase
MPSDDSPVVRELKERRSEAEKKLEKKEEELKALRDNQNPNEQDVSDMNAKIAELKAEVERLSERILAQYALDEAKAELKALNNKKSEALLTSSLREFVNDAYNDSITELTKVVAKCEAKVESFSAPATGGTLHELIADLQSTSYAHAD